MFTIIVAGTEVDEPTESSSSDQESFWPALNRYLEIIGSLHKDHMILIQ